MKKICFILFLFVFQNGFSNMASPYYEGTEANIGLLSKDISIQKERISITLLSQFSAKYEIEYHISTPRTGIQIPLLFCAKNYRNNFFVYLDNQIIAVNNIPEQYKTIHNTPFENYVDYFKADDLYQSRTSTSELSGYYKTYQINELKYFESNLSKGDHIIKVEYIAFSGGNKGDWVTEYLFEYDLSPAAHWKSFGSLDLKIDATRLKSIISTNLGIPISGRLDSIAIWRFNSLPDTHITISYLPKINIFARICIVIHPLGFSIIIALLVSYLHFIFIRKHRRKNHKKRFSSFVIVGSIVIPIFILYAYILFFDLIDAVIGFEAGGMHGYTFLIFIFYPIIMPIYGLIMWIIDRKIKLKLLKNTK